MRTYLDCLPCFMSQALAAARLVSDEPDLHESVIREVAREVAAMDLSGTPPEMGARIHRVIRRLSGSPDPYRPLKERFGAQALDLLPGLRERVHSAADPFDAAVRIALAGNVIDFGASVTLTEEDVLRAIEASASDPVRGISTSRLREMLDGARRILWVGDNAGEIVLDRLVLERIDATRVTYVVRGSPVINDATLREAEESGLTDMLRVITTGADIPGAPPGACGEAFRRALGEADMVVSKGQGNYETLGEIAQPIVLLLKAKCPVISRDIGVELGSLVIEARNV